MLEEVDEVNFWTPRPWGGRFRVLSRGEPLLFRLKTPHNAIAGGGFFEHYSELPLSLAWDAFGEKNGVRSLAALRKRISRLRHQPLDPWVDDEIGCIMLSEPFFWPPDQWIPEPDDWEPNIVRGKAYDLAQGIGRWLWDEVLLRLQAGKSLAPGAEGDHDLWPASLRAGRPIPGAYSESTLQPRRVGQGIFRTVVTDAYDRQCAVTRERALPVLEAAHIRPFAEESVHYVRNGILLRSDVHRLFDSGYLTITDQRRVEVSRRLREEFDDGKNYEQLHGGSVWVPQAPELQPNPETLRWHNKNVYRG